MKIAMISLPSWSVLTAPLGLASLSAVLKHSGHEVKSFDFNARLWQEHKTPAYDLWNYGEVHKWRTRELFDDEVYPLLKDSIERLMQEVADYNPEVIGFTIYQTSIFCTIEGAKIAKLLCPNAKIVFGGPECSKYKLQLNGIFQMNFPDVAVLGEGEATFLEVLNRFKNKEPLKGCLGICYQNEFGEIVEENIRPNISLETLLLPDFSDFNFDWYQEKRIPLMISRGCVAKCTFCAETRFWKNFRYRSAKSIVLEMYTQYKKYGINTFELSDSLINGEFKTLSEMADLIIESGIKLYWGGYARIDKRMTYNLLGRLRKAGLCYLNFGVETGSQKIMDLMEKRTTVPAAYEVITNCKTFSIHASVNIIVGYPGETEGDFQDTIKMIRDLKDSIAVVSTGDTLAVLHGTPLEVNPTKFGIKAGPDGKAYMNERGTWVSEDGTNTEEVRRERLHRLWRALDDLGIPWWPNGKIPLRILPHVDVEMLLANEAAYKYKPKVATESGTTSAS